MGKFERRTICESFLRESLGVEIWQNCVILYFCKNVILRRFWGRMREAMEANKEP